MKGSVNVKDFLILNPNRKSPKVLTVSPCLRILINAWRNFLILDPGRKSPMNSVLTACSCLKVLLNILGNFLIFWVWTPIGNLLWIECWQSVRIKGFLSMSKRFFWFWTQIGNLLKYRPSIFKDSYQCIRISNFEPSAIS